MYPLNDGANIVQRRFFMLLVIAVAVVESTTSDFGVDLVGVEIVIELRRVSRLCNEPVTKEISPVCSLFDTLSSSFPGDFSTANASFIFSDVIWSIVPFIWLLSTWL